MHLLSDSIGRKVTMAITGLLMVLFVIGHLLGNLTIFVGANALNAYAAKLHDIAPLLWGTRIVMGASVLFHLFISIQITLENSAAKPDKYAVKNLRKATFGSETMIWTGVVMAAFIGYHLLHFTFRSVPGLVLAQDALNRFDVYTMVVAAFGKVLTAGVYVAAMIALFFHLGHGIQSAFQTLGLASRAMLARYQAVAKVAAAIFLIGFGSIPAVILAGILSK